MIQFGDSGPHPADIPYGYAALYASDCDYPCPPEAAARFKPENRRWITFTGMPHCSIADFEPGTEVFHDPPQLRRWARARETEDRGLTIVYSDLSNAGTAQLVLGRHVPYVWWLATLDGIQRTAAELSQELLRFGVKVAPEAIWANQWQEGDGYDTSLGFGSWR